VPPPLSQEIVTDALAGRYQPRAHLDDAPHFALRIPSAVTAGVEVFAWDIADPSPSAPLPGVSASHTPSNDSPRNFQ
jgi:hypothetical protein